MRRLLNGGCFCCALLYLAGCGGGGGGTETAGGSGVLSAGSLRVEGKANAEPQTEVSSDLTTYAVTGSFSSATWVDRTPTLDETELLFSRSDPIGTSIVAEAPDGTGRRVVVSGLSQASTNLEVDPTGKFVYYIRRKNLQRTDVRTGASNTLIANVASFAMDLTGAKVFYNKAGTQEIWSANGNGTNQQLLFTRTEPTSVVGVHDASHLILAESVGRRKISFVDLNNPDGISFAQVGSTVTIHWFAFSPDQRAVFFGANDSGVAEPNYFIFKTVFTLDPNSAGLIKRAGPMADLPIGLAAGGPDPGKLVGLSLRKVITFSLEGVLDSPLPGEDLNIESVAWSPIRTSLPLVGIGTSFSGASALLASELGTKTPSIVVADCVTRSTMVAKALNTTGNGNPLYELDCDNLSKLSIADGNGYVFSDVVSAPSGLKGALISFDAATGHVASVLTFTKRPSVTRVASGWKVEGELVDEISPRKASRHPAGASVVLR